jgi:hypothetical protein
MTPPMDATEAREDGVLGTRVQELEAEVGELRRWVGQILIGTTAAFLGVGAFLGFQVWQSGKELESRAVVHQQIQVEQARFDAMVEQLRRFGGSYPDYVPILQRYGIEVPAGMGMGMSTGVVPGKAVQPVQPVKAVKN